MQPVRRGLIVGKIQLFFVSLVGAIPGGYVSYVLVTVFLERAEKMSTAMSVIAGTSLALSGLVTVLPFFVLIFTPKKPFGYGEGDDQLLLAGAGAAAAGGAAGAVMAADDDDDFAADDDDDDLVQFDDDEEEDDDLGDFEDDDDDFDLDDDEDF